MGWDGDGGTGMCRDNGTVMGKKLEYTVITGKLEEKTGICRDNEGKRWRERDDAG